MKSPRALLLYEEGNTCELLRTVILGEGCEVEEAPFDTQTAATPIEGYCLVLFDIQRPTRRLLDVLRAWHDDVPGTALVVIGSRTAQANRIAMLETGVNAYLKKPVIVPELAARVRAALRRFRSHDVRLRQLPFGTGTIDLEARIIRAPEGNVRLTPTECGILEHLALHMNQTVPCSELVKILWGADPQKGVHSLRLFIRKLRQKLEPDPTHPRYLVTEPTIGYRLQSPLEGLSKSAER
jgi:two-component system KDP operon response regulator KdpE